MEYDQKLLRSFWDYIAQANPAPRDGYLRGSLRVSRFVESRLPSWTKGIWDSQMSLVALALDREQMGQLHAFHAGLQAIADIHHRIRRLDAEQDQVGLAQMDAFEKFNHPKMLGLKTLGPSLLAEVERIAAELLSIPLLQVD